MRKFFKEFKAFISKGNVFDLAVGMIIATAFNKIVSSMVNDIIMPLVTYATGAASLAELSVPLRVDPLTKEVTLAWAYGSFLQYVIDFLIIAFSVFIMVKIVTNSRKKFQEFGDDVEEQAKLSKEKRMVKKQAKKEGKEFAVAWEEYLAEKKRVAEEKAQAEAEEKARKEEEDRRNNPTQEQLLKDIRALLEKQVEASKKEEK